ncbi:3-dehydroquinate synthase [Paramaledivibacter caminithermalis]|jgi:3-dehydroquinate synthase|uniref:3-dehydroquinate synthase n=1 Tax=Paramaledivibacter caminithermalis (strain DSM 15212 / CIP 107654 / DViRD3) TaxID=1121301 RepID=A0A1M6PLM7_PARC5|nr:3-dehydroquinate synthase [Paramaledivibacter caminithermalis]SHK08803.1 3-dehydroquinate synthase [Paramaledivibacter caminithermalis DSM 15212]
MYDLEISFLQKKYPIIIEKGIIEKIGKEIKKIYKNKKIAIITDSNIEGLYGKKIIDVLNKCDFETKTIVILPGEKSKSLESAEYIYGELLDFEMTRGDMIIAFGGGVVGDLAGFVASTLLRGIPFIQVPTSLLAQIDSSVGGKVAVNLPQGKNLVGTFYHPEAVFIDPDLLETLDERFLYDGMAEVIKYGCIKDKKLFDRLMTFESKKELLNNIDEIILRCCEIKSNVVERDEKDRGERMLLNFGHTIGHAIEKYYGYKKYTHGEAVAIGMYNITKKSEAMGITEKGTAELIKKILIKYNLPYKMPMTERKNFMEAIGLDKKNKGDNLNIVLIKEIGYGYIKNIDRKDIEIYVG